MLHIEGYPGRFTVFEDNDLLFWVPDVLCQYSEVVLWSSLYYGVSSLWAGLYQWLTEACVGVLVGGAGFLLSGVQ